MKYASKKNLKTSIVVPVSNDLRIRNCLRSIDEQLEIIVVTNHPSIEVISIIKKDKRCVLVKVDDKKCNLALMLNLGAKKASNNKVLITNSDCEFGPGTIRKIDKLLNKYDIVKVRVSFDFRSKPEYLVAKTREAFNTYFNTGKNIFNPGIGFTKRVIPKIGGYLFDEKLGWGEDGDFSRRVHKSSVKYIIIEKVLLHSPESIAHDLSTARKIGAGMRRFDKANEVYFLKGLFIITIELITDRKKQAKLIREKYGYSVVLYLILWKIFRIAGYIMNY